MYNRTMMFDDVLRKAQEGSKDTVQGSNGPGASRNFPPTQGQIYKNDPSQETGQEVQVTEDTFNSAPDRYPPFAFMIAQPIIDLSSRLWKRLMALLPRFDFSDLLPIEFEAKKGAIIFGNHSTESRFIISFKSGTGTYSVAPVRIISIEGCFCDGLFAVSLKIRRVQAILQSRLPLGHSQGRREPRLSSRHGRKWAAITLSKQATTASFRLIVFVQWVLELHAPLLLQPIATNKDEGTGSTSTMGWS